jgi:hypothetical protein
MSIKGLAVLAAALVLLTACDATDGMFPARDDPRLVAEGVVDSQRWAAVAVEDCVELRHDGVAARRSCRASQIIEHFQVEVVVLPGARQPLLFGMLPDGTATAGVAADGKSKLRRDPGRRMLPVTVRAAGGDRFFVAEPAPAGFAGDAVDIEALGAGGDQLTP